MNGFDLILVTLVAMVVYVVVGLVVVSVGGFILGFFFRKGWDRAGAVGAAHPSTPVRDQQPSSSAPSSG